VTGSRPDGSPSRLRPPARDWLLPEPPDPDTVRTLTEALRLPDAVCSILARRGLTDPDEAKSFLRPQLERLHDPSLLADGAVAAARISSAIQDGETILVHGDYDVDGICATALLTRWLRSLGANVVPFVPHRLRDGYDFGPGGLAAAKDAGASLVVTADCGTMAHETLAQASADGIDVVVTDHHTVGADLPVAVAVVNPHREDCSYPDKGLCGTGLAFKMCELIGRARGVETDPLHDYLDLVALATVADLVPLEGENRVLVHFGLRRFSRTRTLGLEALMDVAGVPGSEITAGKLGFVVAPRINAAGRIGESAEALQLLLTEDAEEARTLAERLDVTNRERQEQDQRTLAEVLEQLEARYDPEKDFGVVLAGEGWHPGVIGIVASRVVERIHRPVVMLALDGDQARGSARSIPGFHLYDALAECSEHLLRFGGHKQAAGMDVPREAIPAFREAFNAASKARLMSETLRPTLRTDFEIQLDEADLQLVHWLSYLEPHGMGNPGPNFVARGVQLEQARVVGAGHLKATLVQGPARVDAIGFGLAARHDPADVEGPRYDVAFKLERNDWRGMSRLQARMVGLRLSSPGDAPQGHT
jgi:single-stranded-DNA-specific exonuclease